MSYLRLSVYSIECDADGCNEVSDDYVPVTNEQNGLRNARRDAAGRGWVYRDGRDLCPRHTASFQERTWQPWART